jgi:hypothetical protein
MAWLHSDDLRAKLHAEIDALYATLAKTGAMVLAAPERDRRLAALDEEILRLEREEEQCITEAAGFSMFVPRRETAHPLAVLSLAVVRRQRVVA